MADKPISRTYGYNAKYVRKYHAKLAEVKLRMPPELKTEITAAAAAAGESVNQYMLTATQQRMERESNGNGDNANR